MGISYLKGFNWNDITREERFFCSHLYHSLLKDENKKLFLTLLKSENSPAENIPSTALSDINTNDLWEPGFEVCFYRDMLLKHGISVKKNDLNIVGKEKMIKRTFDLCLFSNKAMVIIEAKCLSELDKKQYSDFGQDKRFIKSMYDYLKQNDSAIEMPGKILMVLLTPSYYYKSVSFKRSNGTGKMVIDDFNNNRGKQEFRFDKFISWKQIAELKLKTMIPGIFSRANGDI
jgi:hypothetical protein